MVVMGSIGNVVHFGIVLRAKNSQTVRRANTEKSKRVTFLRYMHLIGSSQQMPFFQMLFISLGGLCLLFFKRFVEEKKCFTSYHSLATQKIHNHI